MSASDFIPSASEAYRAGYSLAIQHAAGLCEKAASAARSAPGEVSLAERAWCDATAVFLAGEIRRLGEEALAATCPTPSASS